MVRARPRAASGGAATRLVGPARRKARLFCPDCDHESPVDGDWRREESADRVSYACPDCGALVVTQPCFAGTPRP